MSPLRLVIVGSNWSFPHGAGASARIGAYCVGLGAAGAVVHVLCASPTERPGAVLNPDARGRYAGASYEYACGRTTVPEAWLRRKGLKLAGYRGVLRSLRRLGREAPLDAIVYYNPVDAILVRLLHAAARRLGAPLVGEMTESPEVVCTRTRGQRVQKWLNEHGGYRRFDGFVVISDHLRDDFAPRLRPATPLLQVPILVDTAPYDAPAAAGPPSRTLVYCGTLAHRPEILGVLDVFERVAPALPDWRLRILGDTGDARSLAEWRDEAARRGVGARVEFAGALPREAIPSELMRAGVLILPRAAGLRSTAGFPTKLGEYLASGRPVVTTAVGDVSKYLRDGDNAFLAPSADPDAFAARVRDAIAHPEAARAVAERGRFTAGREFECRVQARRLADFLAGLRRDSATGASA